ncbi:MAG: hypothetical protein MR639_00475 [Clostridium sp.]|uniref:hypothetical protein n=1 Tax=Clostridium sp. TaxID=1506 RepID=UPI002A8B56F6|nr:hypothetical protein [Clostridium sp.]MDY5096988.1 hypothetical protein [Clostridium sp.]
MNRYTKEELKDALKVVSRTISNCEKIHPKFPDGTSQHTLLKNRIKALYISQSLINGEDIVDKYSKEELIDSLRPICSVISKCEKGQTKFDKGTSHYNRFENLIKAMYVSKSLISEEINRRE